MNADDIQEARNDPQTYAIIGAAMAVHNGMGFGFLERVYHEALEIEFEALQIPFSSEVPIEVEYRGKTLESKYRADFICYGEVILEIKALSGLIDAHLEQVIHYLKSTDLKRGLLLNFGATKLEYRRVVLDY